MMQVQKNMSATFRVVYVILGAVLVAAPFVASIHGWPAIVLPIMGVMAIVAGGVGL